MQGSAWTTARHADGGARGAPLDLGVLELVFGEAALAADLIRVWRMVKTWQQDAHFAAILIVEDLLPTSEK